MACPRHQPATPTEENLSKLSVEVLRLRLQGLNLPINGSKVYLVERLRAATTGHATERGRPKRLQHDRTKTAKKQPNNRRARHRHSRQCATDHAYNDAAATRHAVQETDIEPDSLSEAGSSVEDLLGAASEADEPADQPSDTLFTPAQLSAIQDTVSASVQAALKSFQGHDVPRNLATPRPSTMATPMGLNRPLDKSLEDKILRGEYIDFTLLLPDSLYRSQIPEVQLRYEDSYPGSQGFPLTLIKRKKAVIDTFHKWLDAFTAYMLVIVGNFPRRSLELIKYQQIISRAVTKFKGLAWLSYDEQFHRCAAYDLSIAWDTIDLELWTVTFSGLAKPHCSVCSSPYHQPDDCPNQDANRKPRRSALVCFDFNKASGCNRCSCYFPHNCRRCGSASHALFSCPSSRQSTSSGKSASSSDRSKK